MKTYLVIEKYQSGKTEAIYQRFAAKGRMLPQGVQYIDSWVEENLQKCYQIMESDHLESLQEWVDKWNDLVDFEIIPVLSTKEVQQKINR